MLASQTTSSAAFTNTVRNSSRASRPRYHLDRLVYHESTPDVVSAISREKQIKGWMRKRKVALIEAVNPRWDDLSADWFEEDQPLRSAQGDNAGESPGTSV